MSNIHKIDVASDSAYLELWQYDSGQILEFEGTDIADDSNVLFSGPKTRKAFRRVCENNRVAIPNKLLRETGKIQVTVETFTENEETTIYEFSGYIKRRQEGGLEVEPEDEPTVLQRILASIKKLGDDITDLFTNKADKTDLNALSDDIEDLDEKKPNYFTGDGPPPYKDDIYHYPKGIKEGDFYVEVGYSSSSSSSSRVWTVWKIDNLYVYWQTSNRYIIRGQNPPTTAQELEELTGIDYAMLGMLFISNTGFGLYILTGNNPLTWSRVTTTDIVYTKTEVNNILLDYGKTIAVSVDPQTYVCTFQLKNGNTVLSTASIDLPLETMVLDVDYDSQTKELVITLKNGTVRRVDVSAIVSGLVNVEDFESAIQNIQDALDEKQDKITAQNKLSADLLESGNTNKVVTQIEKDAWNGKQDELSGSETVHVDNGVLSATESKFKLIKTINIAQLSEQVSMIIVSQDENGNPFGYDDILIDFGSAKTNTDSKIAIDTYTNNDSNPITTFSRANSLNTNAKSVLYDIKRLGANIFEGILGGFYTATKIERKRNAQTYDEKINKIEIYTDGIFTDGSLRIYGRNKY